jgi:Zn-dependent protease
MSGGIRIGRIFGIPVYLHPSWFIVFVLITLTLVNYFAGDHPGWTANQHWVVAIATSILFFASVLFHETAHSVVAMRYRIPVVSITLFVFGGLARIGREPSSARQEFYIAAAGPTSSYVLAGGFWALTRVFPATGTIGALAEWLAQVNFILATFNLVPGFPLDGGRIFRSIVWAWTKNYERATRMASQSGQLLAYLMIFLGIWQALAGNWVGGLWLAFIGWFLLSAAQESHAQVAIRRSLRGLRVSDIMAEELPVVNPGLSLEDYAHDLLRTGRRCHLVVDDGQLLGMMTVHALSRVPREDWGRTSVQAAMLPRQAIHWSRPEEPVLSLLERMQGEDINQMPVLAGDQVVGMVSRDAILRIVQLHLQMGDVAEQ